MYDVIDITINDNIMEPMFTYDPETMGAASHPIEKGPVDVELICNLIADSYNDLKKTL